MKRSELKEIIKAAMLKEADELEIDEAKKDEKEEDIEVDAEETEPEVDLEADPEVDMGDGDMDMGGETSEVLDHLEAALEAAQSMGDEKLINQIGNTITFYTRQHVVKEEELFEVKRMKVLAGILK
jgi:hypothetical protein